MERINKTLGNILYLNQSVNSTRHKIHCEFKGSEEEVNILTRRKIIKISVGNQKSNNPIFSMLSGGPNAVK